MQEKEIEYKSRFQNSIILDTSFKGVFVDICTQTFEVKLMEIKEGKLKLVRRFIGKYNKGKEVTPFKSYLEARKYSIDQANFIYTNQRNNGKSKIHRDKRKRKN